MQDGFSCIWNHDRSPLSASDTTYKEYLLKAKSFLSYQSSQQRKRKGSSSMTSCLILRGWRQDCVQLRPQYRAVWGKQSGTERGFASVLSWSNDVGRISWNRTETFVLDNIKWYIIKGQVFFGTDNTYATYCVPDMVELVPALQISFVGAGRAGSKLALIFWKAWSRDTPAGAVLMPFPLDIALWRPGAIVPRQDQQPPKQPKRKMRQASRG